MTLPREITDILAKYDRWCAEANNDEDYIYDEIHNFFNGELDRGEKVNIIEFLVELNDKT